MDIEPHSKRAFPSWQIKPANGESSLGYFTRLVGEQEHTSARVYANEIELNGRNVVTDDILSELLRLPIAAEHKEGLKRWTPIYRDGQWRLSGETFGRRHISFIDRRFCRGCLAEGRYHRAWWDIACFEVCPFHSTPIEDRDGNGHHIKWWRPSFDVSPTGEQLAVRMERRESGHSFERYILSRLGEGETTPCPLLDSIPLHQVIDICDVLGRLLSHPWRARSPKFSTSHARQGFESMRGTADDLEIVVRRWLVEMVPGDKLKRGLGNGFGWFTRQDVKGYARSPLWPTIDLVLRRAFAQEGRIGRQAAGVSDLPHREVTMREASANFEIDGRGLRELARQLGLIPATSSYDKRAFLTHGEVAVLSSLVDDMISVKTAAVVLGCGQSVVRDLIASGMLRGFQRSGLYGHSGHGLTLLKTEVAALQARAEDVVVSGACGLTHDLAYVARIGSATSSEIIAEVLDGSRQIVSRDSRRRGFASWRFSSVIGKKTYRRQAVAGQIRAAEAAVQSGLSIEVVTALVKAGVIETLHANGRTLLDEKSFRAFDERYVDARLYVDRLGCEPLDLEETLLKMKIPRCFPGVRFRRANVNLVERGVIDKALEVAPGTSEVNPLWELFKEEVRRQCPSFVLPDQLPEKPIKAHLSNRTTYVMIERVEGGFVVSKTFSEKSPREWGVFFDRRGVIVSGMSGFTWTNDAKGGFESSCRVETIEEVVVAASGMAILYHHFKNPRKFVNVENG